MFRKGALSIVALSAICSALFSCLINGLFEDVSIDAVVVYLTYFTMFTVIFGSIYDIIHKTNIKANRCLLGGGISAVIAFTAFFKAFQYSNIYLGYLFMFAFVCFIVLTSISAKYEKDKSEKRGN